IIGTVIDTDIVLRNGFDFYLNSHTTIPGTSQPTFYQVLYDDIGFTSDDIQQLTYYLCHTDVRCTNVIHVPAPIHCPGDGRRVALELSQVIVLSEYDPMLNMNNIFGCFY
ncbi:unnamed protein product, partial [Rotaria sp. Silwood2]